MARGGEDGEKEGDGGEEGDAMSVLKASSLRLRSPNGRGVRAGGRDRRPPLLYVARPSKSGWGVDNGDVVLHSGGYDKGVVAEGVARAAKKALSSSSSLSESRESRGPQRRHHCRRHCRQNRGSCEGRKEGVVVVIVAVRIVAGRPRCQGGRGARGAWSRGTEGGRQRRGGRMSPAARKKKKREEDEEEEGGRDFDGGVSGGGVPPSLPDGRHGARLQRWRTSCDILTVK